VAGACCEQPARQRSGSACRDACPAPPPPRAAARSSSSRCRRGSRPTRARPGCQTIATPARRTGTRRAIQRTARQVHRSVPAWRLCDTGVRRCTMLWRSVAQRAWPIATEFQCGYRCTATLFAALLSPAACVLSCRGSESRGKRRGRHRNRNELPFVRNRTAHPMRNGACCCIWRERQRIPVDCWVPPEPRCCVWQRACSAACLQPPALTYACAAVCLPLFTVMLAAGRQACATHRAA
jgi:hypothetical protein